MRSKFVFMRLIETCRLAGLGLAAPPSFEARVS